MSRASLIAAGFARLTSAINAVNAKMGRLTEYTDADKPSPALGDLWLRKTTGRTGGLLVGFYGVPVTSAQNLANNGGVLIGFYGLPMTSVGNIDKTQVRVQTAQGVQNL